MSAVALSMAHSKEGLVKLGAAIRADQNGKSENPERKHEAQLTILPLQHSKVRTPLFKNGPAGHLQGIM